MSRLFKSAGREIKELLPVWLFFFLAFSLLRVTQTVTVQQYGLHFTTPSLVLLGSLIVAKAFLLIDMFSFVERFRGRPLIYDVLWKTSIYFVGSFIIYFLEQLVELGIKHRSLSFGWNQVTTAVSSFRFGIIMIWLFLLLFAYTAIRETAQAFGKQRFMNLWFGRQERPIAPTEASNRKAA